MATSSLQYNIQNIVRVTMFRETVNLWENTICLMIDFLKSNWHPLYGSRYMDSVTNLTRHTN